MNDPTPSGNGNLKPIYGYFAALTFLVYLVEPTSQFFDIAVTYIMKDHLHATVGQVATFRLITGVPVYSAFVFGLVRDRWSPFGLRDRGFLLLFAPATAAVLVWLAYAPLSYWGLFAGVLGVMVSSRFVLSAYQGLIALVAQENRMSGRLSALWNIVNSVPPIAGSIAAGYIATNVSPSGTFVTMAALALAVAAVGVWKPRAVFGHAYDQPAARTGSLHDDVKRLFRHRAIYPAVLIMVMFQFSPGSGVVLQFYLVDVLHGSDAIYGYWSAIFLASFLPVFLAYGILCRHVPFGRLLWWGTAICVPQMLPLAFVHSVNAALWLAIPIGAMGGIIFAAIYDLAMRSCPAGLQGTMMMLVSGGNALAVRGGDLVGTFIYRWGGEQGFLYCAIATTLMYAAILPVLLLIPRDLLATADGEPAAA